MNRAQAVNDKQTSEGETATTRIGCNRRKMDIDPAACLGALALTAVFPGQCCPAKWLARAFSPETDLDRPLSANPSMREGKDAGAFPSKLFPKKLPQPKAVVLVVAAAGHHHRRSR